MSRLARKKNPPVSSTMEEAEYIGLRLMTEAEYSHPKNLGEFDLKTSSWIDTPQELRSKGGALFCERSYGREFTFHNGADYYYGVRRFRCALLGEVGFVPDFFFGATQGNETKRARRGSSTLCGCL